MNDFKEGLKYNTNHRDIKGIKTSNKRYSAKEEHKDKVRRLCALVLAGALAVGGLSAGVIEYLKEKHEEKYVSNFEEMQEYNVNARDLQIPVELYNEVMNFCQEIDDTDLSLLSNEELAQYFEDISNLDLSLLKNKVANITGKSLNQFALLAPNVIGGEPIGTRIQEDGKITGHINSLEIDKYMEDILIAKDYSNDLLYSDVDRKEMEKQLLSKKSRMGEIMTLNLIRDENGKYSTYRIETKNIQEKSNNSEQEIEK